MKTTRTLNVAAVILLLLLPFILVAQTTDRPNVVLMLADNVGYGDISAYNLGTRGGMKTPNIDQIAADGVQFTQLMVEPGCTPSRAGLMTGQYSIRNGMSMIIPPGAGGGLGRASRCVRTHHADRSDFSPDRPGAFAAMQTR